MSFNVVTSKVSTSDRQDRWTFVYSFTGEEFNKNERGSLYLVASGRTKVGTSDMAYKKEILALIFHNYYRNEKKSAFNALKQTADSVQTKSITDRTEISLSLVSVVETTVYTASFGGGSVNIFRKRMLSQILTSGEETVAASGYPQINDILILSDNYFLKNIDNGELLSRLKMISEQGISKSNLSQLSSLIADNFDEEVATSLYILSFLKKGARSTEIDAIDIKLTTEDPYSPAINTAALDTKRKSLLPKHSVKNLVNLFSGRRNREKLISETEDLPPGKFGKGTTRSIGILLLLMLVISIGFGVRQKQKTDKINEYLPQLTKAKEDFSQAESLYSISPERARELFLSSKTSAEVLSQDGVEDTRLVDLLSKIKDGEGRILGEYNETAENFLDLTLQSDGFSGEDLSLSDGVLYVLDRDGKKIISVAFDTKKSAVVAGPGALNQPNNIASYSDKVYVTSSDGIVRVDNGKDVVFDNKYDNSLIYAYAANLYIVARGESKIYRFSAADGGFGDQDEWLSASAEPDLTQIQSISIDGSIWMVSRSGRVFKFTQGNQVNFPVIGLFPELTAPSQIYTDEDTNYLYILEPSQQRVVVLNKDGNFVAQYISSDLASAIDFGVSEKDKLLVFLTGEKLMSLPLKHL